MIDFKQQVLNIYPNAQEFGPVENMGPWSVENFEWGGRHCILGEGEEPFLAWLNAWNNIEHKMLKQLEL